MMSSINTNESNLTDERGICVRWSYVRVSIQIAISLYVYKYTGHAGSELTHPLQ